jgi:hypothetical protein
MGRKMGDEEGGDNSEKSNETKRETTKKLGRWMNKGGQRRPITLLCLCLG